MTILLYRDKASGREFLGVIEHEPGKPGVFAYDPDYLRLARANGELGISERLPLACTPYLEEDYAPFFRGLLPENEIYGNLSQAFQIPRSDYLSILEQIGCESIGALTFIAEGVDPSEYEPRYEQLDERVVQDMRVNLVRAVTRATRETRLSLSGPNQKYPGISQGGLWRNTPRRATGLYPRGVLHPPIS